MTSALYVVLEDVIPSLNTAMGGEALARAEPALRRRCRELGVRELLAFESEDPEDLATQLEDERGEPVDPTTLEEEEWFPAAEGLATVRALLSELAAGRLEVKDADAVREDLEEMERILSAAHEEGVRWHLAVDP